MSEFKDAYIIVKVLTKKGGKPQHVFLVDSNNEVLEFDTEDEAKNIAELFETNSENGWTYYVKKI
jgi:hypothetical protein